MKAIKIILVTASALTLIFFLLKISTESSWAMRDGAWFWDAIPMVFLMLNIAYLLESVPVKNIDGKSVYSSTVGLFKLWREAKEAELRNRIRAASATQKLTSTQDHLRDG